MRPGRRSRAGRRRGFVGLIASVLAVGVTVVLFVVLVVAVTVVRRGAAAREPYLEVCWQACEVAGRTHCSRVSSFALAVRLVGTRGRPRAATWFVVVPIQSLVALGSQARRCCRA